MSVAALYKESQTDRENWRYTDLAPFAQTAYVPAPPAPEAVLPDPVSPARVVFVNGRFRPDHSQLSALPEGFLTLDEQGVCHMRVAAQTCLALQPLGLLFYNTAGEAPWEGEAKLSLALGPNSRLTLIEKHESENGAVHMFMPRFKIELERQSKLVHGKVALGSAGGAHVSTVDATIAAGAFYDQFSLLCDGRLTRCRTDVRLDGALAGARLSGVALLRGEAKADFLASVFHAAPHGTSRQHFKTVLDDKAKGAFQGKIHVAADAQKTDGHQLSQALLLSDKAEMDAKPELEIYADDVKCSHGSAIGDLSEDELFYLRARGIPEKRARALLVEAFADEIVGQFQSKEIAQTARKAVKKWLSQK